MPANFEMTPETANFRLSPVGFRLWASQYLACRRSFVAPREVYSPVPYFLLCRALELELKARHLDEHPWPPNVKDVKDKFGHNLVKAYKALPDAQRTLSVEEFGVLNAANKIYASKGFEYFSVHEALTGFDGVPSLVALDAVAAKLLPSGV